MKAENIIVDKSYSFALRIVKLYWLLVETKKEYKLSGQILRSGTSIGANVEEAMGGASRKDFKAKLEIAYKEARETKYWLRLLSDTKFINEPLSLSLINDCEEILRILGSIIKTLKTSTTIPNS